MHAYLPTGHEVIHASDSPPRTGFMTVVLTRIRVGRDFRKGDRVLLGRLVRERINELGSPTLRPFG